MSDLVQPASLASWPELSAEWPASTVEFEIGFSSEQSMILFLTHILCALALYG
jgi:hypothetical protein